MKTKLAGLAAGLTAALTVIGVASASVAGSGRGLAVAPTQIATAAGCPTATPVASGTPAPTPTETATPVPAGTAAPMTDHESEDTHKAADIAGRYCASADEVESFHNEGFGYGEIDKAFALAQAAGQTAQDLLARHEAGDGWGEIAHELGLRLMGSVGGARHGHDRHSDDTATPVGTATGSTTPTDTATAAGTASPTATATPSVTVTVQPTATGQSGDDDHESEDEGGNSQGNNNTQQQQQQHHHHHGEGDGGGD